MSCTQLLAHQRYRRRWSDGFTLLELCITTSVVALVTVGTLATLGPVLDRMRLISLVSDFIHR